MKNLIFLLFAVIFSSCNDNIEREPEYDAGENIDAGVNDIQRQAQKAGHRLEEATCLEGDVECAAEKAANRVEEGKDAAVDAAEEAKDRMD